MAVQKTSRNRNSAGERISLTPHRRILVVDDDEDIRSLNTEVLADSGYNVDSAADGSLAWAALQIKNYDLLLTDYDMPRLNGLDLIKRLRAACITIPVIMVSGTVPMKDLRHPWLHIDAALPKPYTFDELLACVSKVLNASESVVRQASSDLPQPPTNESFQTISQNPKLTA